MYATNRSDMAYPQSRDAPPPHTLLAFATAAGSGTEVAYHNCTKVIDLNQRMIEILRRLLGDSETKDRLYECRHCGTIVSSTADVCPTCDSREIGQHDLS